MPFSKIISGFKAVSVTLILLSCGTAEQSGLKTNFSTFASSTLMKGKSCDISKTKCKLKASNTHQDIVLLESLKTIRTNLNSNFYAQVVDISKDDLKTASHSCNGSKCTATFDKKIPLNIVADREFKMGSVAKITLAYLRDNGESEAVAMHRVSVVGETKSFDITKFLSIEVDAGFYLDTLGINFGTGKLNYNYFLRANLTSKVPYFTIAFHLDKSGLGISSVTTKEFRENFIRNRIPVVVSADRITVSQIKKDFIKNLKKQSRDPRSQEYWNQFGNRFIVFEGF